MSAKRSKIIVLGCIIMCFLVGCWSNSPSEIIEPDDEEAIPNSQSDRIIIDHEANQNSFIQKVKVGWNLGCSLESSNFQRYTNEQVSQMRDAYQFMAVYSTKEWSGWDASPTAQVDMNGAGELSWKIETLNSDIAKQVGQFSFQIINHRLVDSGNSKLKVELKKASFEKQDGTVVVFTQPLQSYDLYIRDSVSEYITIDLSNLTELVSGVDVLGGTLKLKIQILSYAKPANNYSITANDYYETLFGNPKTTQEILHRVKEAGFDAVRVPITYYDHMDDSGNIEEEWLNRIQEVVKGVLSEDMYCIINMHLDVGEKGWLTADKSCITKNLALFQRIWAQVSNRFEDYDERLLFEGFNEMLNDKKEWDKADAQSYQAINEYNQAFVDTIRSGNHYNQNRCLIVSTYAGKSWQDILNQFVLPTDTVKDRLIVQIHEYGGKEEISSMLKRVNARFITKQIPVVISEFGYTADVPQEERLETTKFMVTEAKKYQIPCFWWDDGGGAKEALEVHNYALLNRNTLEWYFPELVDGLIDAAK